VYGQVDLPFPSLIPLLEPCGEKPRLLNDKGVIEKGQGLQGRQRRISDGSIDVRIRTVQAVQERVRHAADHEAVHRPPVRRGVVDAREVRMIVHRRMIVLEPELLGRRTAHRRIQLAADGQHRVAHRFGVQPLPVGAPQVAIEHPVGADAPAMLLEVHQQEGEVVAHVDCRQLFIEFQRIDGGRASLATDKDCPDADRHDTGVQIPHRHVRQARGPVHAALP
jgi:hypothetical protein